MFATDSAAAEFDAGVSLIEDLRRRILVHLALKSGMIIAEIGVGGGWFVIRIAEAIGTTGVVYGTDIDPNAIATVQREVADLPSAAARVDLRLCRHGHDTALDDLPDDHVDIVLMVDSLCFDAQGTRARNVAYLRRFRRILRPGGRLVHHMDCKCDVRQKELVALFTDAGFSSRIESLDATPHPDLIGTGWPCRSGAERKRHALVAVFRKPSVTPGAGIDR